MANKSKEAERQNKALQDNENTNSRSISDSPPFIITSARIIIAEPKTAPAVAEKMVFMFRLV